MSAQRDNVVYWKTNGKINTAQLCPLSLRFLVEETSDLKNAGQSRAKRAY